MKNMSFKHTGKCVYCGESTHLLIHKGCGRRYRQAHKQKRQKAPKTIKYSDAFIQKIIDMDY